MLILTQEQQESKNNLVDWSAHKSAAVTLATRLARMPSIPKGRVTRMLNCGDTIGMRYCPSCGYRHITHTHSCKDRLCPLCSWRLAIKRYHEMRATIEYLSGEIEDRQLKAFMLTLTVKNCKSRYLRETLAKMSEAWDKMRHHKALRDVAGWGRCTEVTFNQSTKQFHPHYHILLLVPQEIMPYEMEYQCRMAWQRAAQLPYVPVIDVRAAYCKDGENDIIKCAGEAFSYSIKPMTVSGMSDYYLESFANQMAGFRLTGFGGIIKQARAELKITDEEKDDDHRPDICQCGSQLEEMLLAWSAGGYSRIEKVGAAK